jgi:beta-apo-4'-carotenal oxygenase
VLDRVSSGGASFNDVFVHATFPQAPFGGIGQSGCGSYRGKASYDTFSHRRTIAEAPKWSDALMRMRYMPYSFKRIEQSPLRPPWSGLSFDREGNPVRGLKYWFGFFAGLGASGPKGALLRWVIVLVSALALIRRSRSVGA